jgi:choice-of-anchor A domain-containing protein
MGPLVKKFGSVCTFRTFYVGRKLRSLLASVLVATSVPTFALPLTDYNLILLEDLNSQSIHVYGKTFVGGDIYAQAWLEFGSRLDKSTQETSLEVVGNLNGQGMHVQAGYATWGGENNLGGSNCNGDNLSGGKCLLSDADLNEKAADIANELYASSQEFASLLGNGDLFVNGNQKTLKYTGDDDIAVFNLDGTAIFSQNTSWALDAGSAQTVIINVSGKNIAYGGGVNLTNGFSARADANNIGASNILWNFYEAETINFDSMRVNGSVLAPYALVTMGNDIDGALAARSYSGRGQVHNELFNWTPPPPVTQVSESSTLMLLLMGLGLISLVRLRR